VTFGQAEETQDLLGGGALAEAPLPFAECLDKKSQEIQGAVASISRQS
jgi:hypothetical protein